MWTFTLTNTSTGKTFTMTVPYSSSEDTVEWITETPLVIGGGGTGIAAMPNLGKVVFDLGLVNGANPHLIAGEAIRLVTGGQVVAIPSAPDSDTDGFGDCVWATSCSAPGS